MNPDLYPHRGFMPDTGRKFFPVPAILELLTVLHDHNFNVFHWHIYDAESFPLPWPADGGLTATSMQYSHTAEYYTVEDIQRVIVHAQQLDILGYSETGMPGHCDIWGLWKKELVVGTPDLAHPHAQLDIRPHRRDTNDHIASLVSTVQEYFGTPPLHHFGGDEVAPLWQTGDDNALFASFLHWLRSLCPPHISPILWDDPLTDAGKHIALDPDWIIQTWHPGATSAAMLRRGHRVIVSEADTFYIGKADYGKVTAFAFPHDDTNVLGFEAVWFTSAGDDPWDFRREWVMGPIRAAGEIRRARKDA
ncbi:putative beta-hexosaminidase [Aspergillus ellipticus CBS 707.79]|uniref:beta-N-acetylhexosaminidase n=1 Tax=Aspergillus ellipticus CBS 707.79 TaxID=1448320 RepID=A0A319DHV6_9EURO|nr:putative beta-hexosaminidase [Aspergillus ellipticus CBS 707.79]